MSMLCRYLEIITQKRTQILEAGANSTRNGRDGLVATTHNLILLIPIN